jgi:hypothetical protein
MKASNGSNGAGGHGADDTLDVLWSRLSVRSDKEIDAILAAALEAMRPMIVAVVGYRRWAEGESLRSIAQWIFDEIRWLPSPSTVLAWCNKFPAEFCRTLCAELDRRDAIEEQY